MISKAVAPLKPQAAVFAVDPAAAARVAEDLDYRIAERIGSVEGWRSFLAVHGSGVHAQSATGEVERLLLSEQTSAQTTAKVQMTRPSAPKLRVITCSLPRRGAEVAALTPDSGVASLGHEPAVTAAEGSYVRPPTRRQRAMPCNPPCLRLGRRSRPLRATKTPSIMGTVWSNWAIARAMWPDL